MSEQETDNKTPPAAPAPKDVAAKPAPGKPHRPRPNRAEPGDGHPVAPAVAGPDGRSGRLALGLAVVAIIVGIGVAVTAFFTWREVDRVVAGRQQDVQQAQTRSSGLESRLQDTARRIDSMQMEVERSLDAAARDQRDVSAKLEEAQQDVERTVALMRAQMGRSQDGWLLSEVEYLLRIANQRLQLQRDADTALAALVAADDRLRALSDPGYLPVRQALAQEIAQLKAAPRVDISGLALALASLKERVDGLQVAGARYTPAQDQHGDVQQTLAASDWREVPAVIWQAIRRLLAIRTHNQPATPMLPPDQQYFLYQNLHLVLESARLALLQSDPGNYRTSLATAQQWLQTYFDQDHPATASLSNELFHLAQKDIRPSLPDVSESLRLLRQQMAVSGSSKATGEGAPVEEVSAEEATPASEPAPQATPDAAEPAAVAEPQAVEGAQP